MTVQAEQAKATHKGNGDSANHANLAHAKTARDYYIKCEGKTRDEARVIVDRLVKGNLLQPIAFYVKAIKDEAIRQENLRKREEQQKEREAQDKKDEEARKAREEQAKKDSEQANASKASGKKSKAEPEACSMSKEQFELVTDFINKGAGKTTIAGLLRDLFGFNKCQVLFLIDELLPASSSKGQRSGLFEGDTFKGRFYRRLLEGVMNVEEFDKMISEESENVQKHKSAHNNVRVMSNRIHEKYAQG
jgi:hypothetical protein